MSGVTLTTVAQLAEAFDVFLLDQFGVLHNGQEPYPGALDALERLQAAGKQVILLSNSGKRAEVNQVRMERLGFSRDLFQRLVTSGEVAHALFQEQLTSLGLQEGARCFIISRDTDRSALDGTSLQEVPSAEEADVVILMGSEADREAVEVTLKRLQPALDRNLPCVCLNPDKWMLTPSGLCAGSGTFAEHYETQGGAVLWIGKPYPEIYHFAQQHGGFSQDEAVAIGDSIEHDIAGATRFGCAGALVRSGILVDATPDELEQLMTEHQARPQFELPTFCW